MILQLQSAGFSAERIESLLKTAGDASEKHFNAFKGYNDSTRDVIKDLKSASGDGNFLAGLNAVYGSQEKLIYTQPSIPRSQADPKAPLAELHPRRAGDIAYHNRSYSPSVTNDQQLLPPGTNVLSSDRQSVRRTKRARLDPESRRYVDEEEEDESDDGVPLSELKRKRSKFFGLSSIIGSIQSQINKARRRKAEKKKPKRLVKQTSKSLADLKELEQYQFEGASVHVLKGKGRTFPYSKCPGSHDGKKVNGKEPLICYVAWYSSGEVKSLLTN